MHRRKYFAFSLGTLACGLLPGAVMAQGRAPFDMKRLKGLYAQRIASIRRSGALPIIDIESSYDPRRIDLAEFVRAMDRNGIALMALSVDQPGQLVERGETWGHQAHELVAAYPDRFIPTGNGGNHPAWTKSPGRFLGDNERYIVQDRYPLMGEFEFRHYPSPRQVQRGEWHRDVNISIDGPEGNRLFSFAQRTGVPFQIHYEIEDALLPPLETMLGRYPRAKVIWCHCAQVRYAARAPRYGAAYLRGLLVKHPNLYVDTAFGGPNSVYPVSGERHARVWAPGGDLRPEWRELIAAFPYRFLAALDIGGDRMERLDEWSGGGRRFLERLPPDPRDRCLSRGLEAPLRGGFRGLAAPIRPTGAGGAKRLNKPAMRAAGPTVEWPAATRFGIP